MSITPFVPQLPPTAPTGAAVSTGPGAGDPAAAGFAALVASMLGAATAAPTGLPTPVVTSETAQVEAEPTDEEPESDTTETAALAGLGALLAGVPPLTTRPLSVATATVTDDPGTTAATTEATAAEHTTGPATPDAATGESADPQTQDAPVPAAAAPAAPTASTAPTAPGSPSTVTPAPAVAPTLATAPATSATPVAGNPVTAQVIPEVTRLASHGNGTHRITMTLKPEALGEVRVTLTVRDGEVRVRLAAGDEAQRALVEGAPELRRILELTGATDTRVVVRDLGQASTSSQTTPFSAGTGADRGDTAATGHGRGGPHDQHAGTRGGTNARDGLSDGAHAPRHEPVRNARSTGVDLTM